MMSGMRIQKTVVTLLVFGAACFLWQGCSKKADKSPPAPAESDTKVMKPAGSDTKMMQPAVDEAARLKAEAEAKAADIAKAAEDQAAKLKAAQAEAMKLAEEQAAKVKAQAEAARKAAEEQVNKAKAEFEARIAKIKQTIDAKKYQDALASIQETLALKGLTADQKTLLEKLLETVKKAMAADVATEAKSKLGNALKGLGK